MVSVASGHLKRAAIETEFICVSAPVEIGSLIDGWKVVWCMPDQNRIIWHVIPVTRNQRRGGHGKPELATLATCLRPKMSNPPGFQRKRTAFICASWIAVLSRREPYP